MLSGIPQPSRIGHDDLDLPRSFPRPALFYHPGTLAVATQEVAQAPLNDLEILSKALGQSGSGNVCGFVVFNDHIAHV